MDPLGTGESDSRTDEELLKAIKRSYSNEVLTILFTRYQHLVFGVCMKYLQNIEDSKDAVMDIFEKVFTEFKKHNVVNFRGWLYVLSRNHALMKLRNTKSRSEQDPMELFMDDHMESSQSWHPFYENESGRDLEWLDVCMKELPENQRECIRSFYMEKISYKELSEIRGEALNKIKSYIQNGRRNLRTCMENKSKAVQP